MTPTPPLRVQLLGNFLLARGDSPITSVSSPRLQSLLAYLILHRDAPQVRQHLAFLFWSDSSETNARNNLRQLLFELRHALPDVNRFVDIESTTIQWRNDAPFTCDVIDLQHALKNAESNQDARTTLEQVIASYRGDLLPGCYDDWIASEREQLRDQFIGALDKLIDFLEHTHDYPGAISYAQKLLHHDQLHESTYRRLMRLYSVSGDRASALRTYHTCATVLQQELAVEPSMETRVEYERLLNREAQPLPSSITLTGVSPLVGRQREWAQLQSAWHDAASGQPQMIILQGEAGIGKTRLADELVAWVNRQGISNASAHCFAAENAPPYAPIITWLRAHPLSSLDEVWMAELARLLPELARAHPEWRTAPLTEEWQRQRLFEAMARALLAQPQPLLLFIDDLQWCDRDTLACLRFLLRFDSQARLLIVGTLRGEEIDAAHPVTALFLALRQSTQFTKIELCPLDKPETISLATNVLGREIESALATQVYHETEGNPLFVVEIARELSVNAQSLPPKVQAAIAARLTHLSLPARELADVAATIGRDFAFDVLAKSSGADEDALVRGLDELWQRRIVREHGALTYDFTHAKLREVILSTVSPMRLHMLHRRVGEALETIHATDLDSVSAQIAAHFEQAGKIELAVRYYERAAQVARRLYSNQEAIEHYRHALALCTPSMSQEDVARLYENLGRALRQTGQYDQSKAVFQSALTRLTQPLARARLYREMGATCAQQHQYQEALQAFAEAEQNLNQISSDQSLEWWRERIAILLGTGDVYYWLGQLEQDDRLRQTLGPLIQQYGTPSQRAGFYIHVSNMEFRRNRSVATPETVAMTKAALAAYQEAQDEASIPNSHFMVGFRVLWSGDPESAMEPLETAWHFAEKAGSVSFQARCLTYLTVACRQREQIEATRQYAERSLQMATIAQMPEYVGTAKANQSWLAYRAGELSQAKELGLAALEEWHQLPASHASLPFQWLALMPLIAVAVDEQQLSVAVDYAQKLLNPALQRLPDALTDTLERAINPWDKGVLEASRTEFEQAIRLARQMRYL